MKKGYRTRRRQKQVKNRGEEGGGGERRQFHWNWRVCLWPHCSVHQLHNPEAVTPSQGSTDAIAFGHVSYSTNLLMIDEHTHQKTHALRLCSLLLLYSCMSAQVYVHRPSYRTAHGINRPPRTDVTGTRSPLKPTRPSLMGLRQSAHIERVAVIGMERMKRGPEGPFLKYTHAGHARSYKSPCRIRIPTATQ